MPLSESMQSKGYRFDFDGTTGVENVNTDGVDTDAVYDLQGRKVKMPAKGVYIVNGKKVLIRLEFSVPQRDSSVIVSFRLFAQATYLNLSRCNPCRLLSAKINMGVNHL